MIDVNLEDDRPSWGRCPGCGEVFTAEGRSSVDDTHLVDVLEHHEQTCAGLPKLW